MLSGFNLILGLVTMVIGMVGPGILFVIAFLFVASAVVGLAVGWGLLQRKSWARMLAIVIGCPHLVGVPFGMALGIYTLWVLWPAGSKWDYREVVLAALVAADFTGTWKLNLAESNGTNDLESRIMKIEQTGPNMDRTTIDDVLQSGAKRYQEINRVYDGKEHPTTGVGIQEGRSEICQLVDRSTRKVTQKDCGKVVSEFISTVSSNGKVMTNHRTGNHEETLIFEKQ